jgi:hypothetical protein
MTSTGVLSSTLLKDVAIGILLARLGGVRGLTILGAAAATLGFLRIAVSFALVNAAGPPLAEAAVFLVLFFWLRQRGHRTFWGEGYAH